MSQDKTPQTDEELTNKGSPEPLPKETATDSPLEPSSIEKDDESCSISSSQ